MWKRINIIWINGLCISKWGWRWPICLAYGRKFILIHIIKRTELRYKLVPFLTHLCYNLIISRFSMNLHGYCLLWTKFSYLKFCIKDDVHNCRMFRKLSNRHLWSITFDKDEISIWMYLVVEARHERVITNVQLFRAKPSLHDINVETGENDVPILFPS